MFCLVSSIIHLTLWFWQPFIWLHVTVICLLSSLYNILLYDHATVFYPFFGLMDIWIVYILQTFYRVLLWTLLSFFFLLLLLNRCTYFKQCNFWDIEYVIITLHRQQLLLQKYTLGPVEYIELQLVHILITTNCGRSSLFSYDGGQVSTSPPGTIIISE